MPLGESSLVVVPGPVDDALVPHLLALSDVASTGHHAAVSAHVGPGDVVVVVGDGAVGLSAVLAASRLGASRVIAMSRHADRQAVAREFGATDIIEERGEDAIAALRALLDGDLADAALECVGTAEAMEQALGSVRGGGRVGFVGVPGDRVGLDVNQLFSGNITIGGGMAPARTYIPELLPGGARAARCSPARCSTWSCRSPRSPRPTPRWTSAARSRCCCGRSAGARSRRSLHRSPPPPKSPPPKSPEASPASAPLSLRVAARCRHPSRPTRRRRRPTGGTR